MSSPFREEAIPLVTLDEEKFKVNPEALDILRHVTAPIVVVGVAGLYRTGKSYLLNRIILNRERGFGVASTINACTKGIWMWGKPLKAQTEKNEIVNLIIIDSEGLGALDQDSAHDCRIFALVLLLSSVFIYNSVGAIDESAISNLSLVINLTKHIRIKAGKEMQGKASFEDNSSNILTEKSMEAPLTETPSKPVLHNDEEDDSDEFANYFPAFMWVVRDFSLQLVDEDGDAISAKQYLELALQQRPGISDDLEHKNRIRRLIQNFFRERDCFTLVRPLTDEESLKRLDDIEMENLRPEFIYQALDLRKKIMSLNKKKTLRGKNINGEFLGSLLLSYVNAINGGAVPNIESAWDYICKRHTRNLVDGCVAEFVESAKEKVESNMPMSARSLKTLMKEIRLHAMARFRRDAMIADAERAIYEGEIKQSIREIKNNLKADNDHDFENLLLTSLNNHYNESIYQKLVDERVSEARDVVSLLQETRKTFEKVEPDGPRKLERLFRFLFTRSCEAHQIIWKNKMSKVAHEIADKDRACEQRLHVLEEQCQLVGEEKQAAGKRIDHLQKQLYDTEFERSKLQQTLSNLQEELAALEQETAKKRAEEKAFYKSKQDELVKKLEESEKAFRAIEAAQIKQKTEFDTEVALLRQKIEFSQRLEGELNDQIAKLQKKMARAEEEFIAKQGQLAQDYEQRLKAQSEELARLKEQKQHYELQLGSKINAHESMFKDFEEKEDELRSFINTHEKTILSLKEQLKTRDAQTLEKTEQEVQFLAQLSSLEDELKVQEQKLKARDDKIQLLNIALDKEQAINKQNSEFYEIKLGDLNAQIEELKRVKENAFQVLQTSSGVKSDLSKQLQELRNGFEERIKKMSEEFEAERDELIAKMTQQAEEEEYNLKELKKEKEALLNEKIQLSASIDSARETIERLELRIQFFEKNKSETLKETEAFYEEKVKKLERQMDEELEEKSQELRETRGLLEENMKNMQQAFESEKTRLEKKLIEEKGKFDSFIKGNLEDLEKKRQEEVQGLEEEIENLQLELQSQDLKFRASIQKMENEVSVAKSKQDAAERKTMELKMTLEKDLATEKNKIVLQAQSHEQERKSLLDKAEALKAELTSRSLEIFQLRQSSESLASAQQRLITEHDKALTELLNERVELKSRIENLMQEKYTLNDELITTSTQLSKEAALNAQKIEYLEKRISELTKSQETAQNEYDERVKFLKKGHEEELAKVKSSLQEELALWESRYEEKKKSAKEIETALSQKITELERSRYILQERLSQAELRKEEVEKKLELENARVDGDLKRFKDNHLLERKNLFNEVESLRKDKYELEISLAETAAKFDKDRAVLDGKISFLEQQNKKLKNDLSESQTNFDVMFQKFHQFRVADKEETEQTHSSYVLAIEQRYNAQILEIKEQNKVLIDTYKEKLRNMEREVRRLEQANQELSATRQGTGNVHERKVNELLENEKRLQDEILKVRSELDKLTLTAQKEFEKEREALKKKNYDAEAKIKKFEAERSLLILEQEKQKTKWHIEKDQLFSQKSETLEQLDRLQKQKESLMRDNEKLKTDLKALRKVNLTNNLLSMTKMNNRSDLFSVDKSVMSPREYMGNSNKTGNSSPLE